MYTKEQKEKALAVYGHALESLSKIDDGSLLPIFYNFSECGTTWIRNVAIKHIREQK